MNTHPTEFIPGYVLGALDDRERQVVAQHLAICPQCRREAESFYTSVESPRCAPHALPAGGVKHRLMLRVHASVLARATMGRSWWRGWAVAAALLLAIVGVSVGHGYYTAIHAQGQADIFLRDPHTLRRPLPGLGDMRATLYTQPGQRRALLDVAGMPALPTGSVYQIWFAHGSAAVASATFAVDAGGAATVLCDTPDPIAETYSQVMVTVEPAGGSATPSGEPLFSATLMATPGVLRSVAQLFALDQVGDENQRLTLLITVRYDT